MTADIGQLSGRPHDSAWEDAQVWKDRAKEIISDVFSETPNTRDRLLDRLKGVFVSQPSYVSADGTSSPPIPDSEQQRIFETDISEALDIIDECCREFKRLLAKYR